MTNGYASRSARATARLRHPPGRVAGIGRPAADRRPQIISPASKSARANRHQVSFLPRTMSAPLSSEPSWARRKERHDETSRIVIPIWDVAWLDGRKASFPGGIRRVIPTSAALRRRRLWPMEFHLMQHHTHHTFCSETPVSFPMEQRVQAHHAALKTALEILTKP